MLLQFPFQLEFFECGRFNCQHHCRHQFFGGAILFFLKFLFATKMRCQDEMLFFSEYIFGLYFCISGRLSLVGKKYKMKILKHWIVWRQFTWKKRRVISKCKVGKYVVSDIGEKKILGIRLTRPLKWKKNKRKLSKSNGGSNKICINIFHFVKKIFSMRVKHTKNKHDMIAEKNRIPKHF